MPYGMKIKQIEKIYGNYYSEKIFKINKPLIA